jgi:putative tryptophan/tyrosine transport system substrate-binding protein
VLGGAAASSVSWPLAARAQQSPMPVIGFLSSVSPAPWAPFVAAFRQGLSETGFIDGQNVTIEYRWAEGRYERLPELSADLVRRHVAVILAGGGSDPARAAKAATTGIPIVFVSAADPINAGLIASFNRPGENVTGVSLIGSALEAKRLELLHQLAPTASAIAALVNPNYPDAESQSQEVREAATHLGVRPIIVTAGTERDIDNAFANLVRQGAGALLVAQDSFFNSRRDYLMALAASHALPAIYSQREFTADGGLASYGAHFADGFRQAGVYAGKILKGTKAANLPVQQPTKFEFVINLKTVKALGLSMPDKLLALADEVIE